MHIAYSIRSLFKYYISILLGGIEGQHKAKKGWSLGTDIEICLLLKLKCNPQAETGVLSSIRNVNFDNL